MKYLLWGIIVIGAVYCMHRIAIWAAQRGWIYYCGRGGSSGAWGNAFLELQTIFEPSKRHVIEERVKKHGDLQTSGEKPDTGPAKSEIDTKA
jgi:hypothetical protein